MDTFDSDVHLEFSHRFCKVLQHRLYARNQILQKLTNNSTEFDSYNDFILIFQQIALCKLKGCDFKSKAKIFIHHSQFDNDHHVHGCWAIVDWYIY